MIITTINIRVFVFSVFFIIFCECGVLQDNVFRSVVVYVRFNFSKNIRRRKRSPNRKENHKMNLTAIEELANVVQRTMNSWSRNDYERQNLVNSNLERLHEARTALRKYDGDYATKLLRRIDLLKESIDKKEEEFKNSKNKNFAFKIDFQDEVPVEEELGIVEEALKQKEQAKAEKKIAKRGARGKKGRTKLLDSPADDEEKDNSIVLASKNTLTVVDEKELLESQNPQHLVKSLYELRKNELSRRNNVSTHEIQESIVHHSGTAYAEEGTAQCYVEFDGVVDDNFSSCKISVKLYRCVLFAGLLGKPLITPDEVIPSASLGSNSSLFSPTILPCSENNTTNLESSNEEQVVEEDEKEQVTDAEFGAIKDRCSAEELQLLSMELVQAYTEAQQHEEEEEAAMSNSFPKPFNAGDCSWIRGVTNSVWTILLCHGGYFAGGIFFNGQCIVHKAFQRYVVRKKQGGKQSNAQKDGGSFGSIGSQIRAAQEVKWRIDVRDILLEWNPFIDASFAILYAAPGPSNRSILTDFSLVPGSGAKSNAVSPVNLQNPRVCKVPITTHRPTYLEIQRIFSEVSVCSIVYFQ